MRSSDQLVPRSVWTAVVILFALVAMPWFVRVGEHLGVGTSPTPAQRGDTREHDTARASAADLDRVAAALGQPRLLHSTAGVRGCTSPGGRTAEQPCQYRATRMWLLDGSPRDLEDRAVIAAGDSPVSIRVLDRLGPEARTVPALGGPYPRAVVVADRPAWVVALTGLSTQDPRWVVLASWHGR